jgi:hypothetical protein
MLLLAQIPCDVLSDGEGFWSPSTATFSGLCWFKTLQECLNAVYFFVIEEFFQFLCCLPSNIFLSDVLN